MAICIVEGWKKSMGYLFVSVCNHAEENHACQFFRSFYRLGPRFVEIHKFCYHDNVTNDISSLLAFF